MGHLFSSIATWQLWAVAGIILCILEIFTPGFFLLALGLGCLLAAAGALFLTFNGQLALFIIGSLFTFFIARKFIRYSKSMERLGMTGLIGRCGTAVNEITTNSGQVRVGGELWPARCDTGISIREGATVEVMGFEGNRLKVKEMRPIA